MSELFKTIEIEINHGCNLACSYCPNEKFERIEKGNMELSLYNKLIGQLCDLNYQGKISYSFYNEPTLSTSLEQYVQIAKENLNNIQIELYTNGTLLTLEKFQQLIKSGVDKFIITKHEHVEDYVFDETILSLTSDELKKVVYKQFNEIHLTNRGGLLKQIPKRADTTFFPCLIPMNMISVTVKGNVVPCFEDFYQKNQMGNIGIEHIKDIWQKKEYVQFRENLKNGLRHKFEVCKDCSRTEVAPPRINEE